MLERVMRKSAVLGADDFADLYESHIRAIFMKFSGRQMPQGRS